MARASLRLGRTTSRDGVPLPKFMFSARLNVPVAGAGCSGSPVNDATYSMTLSTVSGTSAPAACANAWEKISYAGT